MLKLPALAQVVLRRRPLLILGRRRDLRQADNRDAELLRHAVQPNRDIRHDVPALAARGLQKLDVVDEDHVEAAHDRPPADLIDRPELVQQPDPARRLAVCRSRDLLPVVIAQRFVLGPRQVDARRLDLCEQTVGQRIGVRLQGEEADLLSGLRHAVGKLQSQCRLADGAVRRQDHELAAADVEQVVELLDPEAQVVRRGLVAHAVTVAADQLVQGEILEVLQLPEPGAEIFISRSGLGQIVAAGDRHGGRLDRGQLRRVPDQTEIDLDACRRRRRLHALGQELFILAARCRADRDRVDRLPLRPEPARCLEDVPQGSVAEMLGPGLRKDHPRRMLRVDQQGAYHSGLRLLPCFQIHGSASSRSSAPWGRASRPAAGSRSSTSSRHARLFSQVDA